MSSRTELDLPWVSSPEHAGHPPAARIDDHSTLAEAIVETISKPLLVLDSSLRVVTANHAFHHMFGGDAWTAHGQDVRTLGNGCWDLPGLRVELAQVLPQNRPVEGYEAEALLPGRGLRTLLLDAREMANSWDARRLVLLTVEDVTERRAAERETAALLCRNETLLRETEHRVANSLQIISSILLLKAGGASSDEARLHLKDAHRRIMCVAAVQRQLDIAQQNGRVALAPFLSRLCAALSASLLDDNRALRIEVQAFDGTVRATKVVSLGLIVTELVINAFKHAFAADGAGLIVVGYETDEAGWRLTVSDNGAGMPDGPGGVPRGLGTGIVAALARLLDARVETGQGENGVGTMVSVAGAQDNPPPLRPMPAPTAGRGREGLLS